MFKDRSGRIVLAQLPNLPIVGWALFAVASLVTSGAVREATGQVSTAFLFMWAYLEITAGVNYFRRILGVAVMIAVVVGFFR